MPKDKTQAKFPVEEIELRVRYAETDQMGVVYYANYLVWFEIARTEYFRKLGLQYTEMEKKGIYLVVAESNCKYKSSVSYDDLIRIKTGLNYVKSSSLEFAYEVTSGKRVIATGRTVHVFVNREMKPVRVPGAVFKTLKIEE